MTLYPQILCQVKESCANYRSRTIGIEQLQSIIWNAAEQIVAREEKELRRSLQNAESKLELFRFTVDSEQVYEQSLMVVAEIERQVKEWE